MNTVSEVHVAVINRSKGWKESKMDNRVYDLVGEESSRQYMPMYINTLGHRFRMSLPGFSYDVLTIFNVAPMQL